MLYERLLIVANVKRNIDNESKSSHFELRLRIVNIERIQFKMVAVTSALNQHNSDLESEIVEITKFLNAGYKICVYYGFRLNFSAYRKYCIIDLSLYRNLL